MKNVFRFFYNPFNPWKHKITEEICDYSAFIFCSNLFPDPPPTSLSSSFLFTLLPFLSFFFFGVFITQKDMKNWDSFMCFYTFFFFFWPFFRRFIFSFQAELYLPPPRKKKKKLSTPNALQSVWNTGSPTNYKKVVTSKASYLLSEKLVTSARESALPCNIFPRLPIFLFLTRKRWLKGFNEVCTLIYFTLKCRMSA